MNLAYRKLMMSQINSAMNSINSVKDIQHKSTKGEIREIIICELLRPLLPPDIGIASGIIITSYNRQSTQQDIIIYDKRVLPSILFKDIGLIPIESALYTIEVKSKLKSQDIKRIHDSGKLLSEFKYLPQEYDEDDKIIETNEKIYRPNTTLFALDSDISSIEEVVQRYDKIRGEEYSHICGICVVGKGHTWQKNDKWHYTKINEEYEEVLGFVSIIIHSYPIIMKSRGRPRLGLYVSEQFGISIPKSPSGNKK